jgi:hypothetical protein
MAVDNGVGHDRIGEDPASVAEAAVERVAGSTERPTEGRDDGVLLLVGHTHIER